MSQENLSHLVSGAPVPEGDEEQRAHASMGESEAQSQEHTGSEESTPEGYGETSLSAERARAEEGGQR